MTLKVDVTVAALAESDGRFLIVQERAARRIVLNQPAGHLEAGESLQEAVIRETLEETGRVFEPRAVVGLYLWRGTGERSVLRVAFAGPVGERDESVALDRGIIRTLWLERAQLEARSAELRSPLVLKCIDDYLAGVRHPLSVLSHVPADELPELVLAPARR